MPCTLPTGCGTNAAGPARFQGDFGAIGGQVLLGTRGAAGRVRRSNLSHREALERVTNPELPFRGRAWAFINPIFSNGLQNFLVHHISSAYVAERH